MSGHWTTTTPPVAVVSSVSATIATFTLAPKVPTAVLGQHDVGLLLPLILKDIIGGVVGLTTVLQQQPQSQMPSQVYAMGPS